MLAIEEGRLRDKLERLERGHRQFIKRSKDEDSALQEEKSRYELSQSELGKKYNASNQKQRTLRATVNNDKLKTANIVVDINQTNQKLEEIQAKIEGYHQDLKKAEKLIKNDLNAINIQKRQIDVRMDDMKKEASRLSESSQQWERTNSNTVTECDQAKRTTCETFIRWIRLYPLIHHSFIADDALLASLRKTATTQGRVAEWKALRQLAHNFKVLYDDYTTVPRECSNLLTAQQEHLRHISSYCDALHQRAATITKKCSALTESIKQNDSLRRSLLVLLSDLNVALDADLAESLKHAERVVVRPLAVDGAQSNKAEPDKKAVNGGSHNKAAAAAAAVGDGNLRETVRVEDSQAWNWCRSIDIQRNPDLETIQCALNTALSTEQLLSFEPSVSASPSQGGRGGVSSEGNRTWMRTLLQGLETRRVARDLQFASTLTAHESVRRFTHAMSRKDSSASAGGYTKNVVDPLVDGILSRYFEYCSYIPAASHLAIATQHSFPCAPELLSAYVRDFIVPSLQPLEAEALEKCRPGVSAGGSAAVDIRG